MTALEQYDIPLAGAKKWISIAVKAEISEVSGELILPLHEERELIPISVMQILEENLKPYCRFSCSRSRAADAEDRPGSWRSMRTTPRPA